MRDDKLDRMRSRLGFQHATNVNPIGLSGGLSLWRRDGVSLQVLLANKNMIHILIINGVDELCGMVTFVYGPPTPQDRAVWWRSLSSLNLGDDGPWICLGDFNDIMFNGEKEGGRLRSESQLYGFSNFMHRCNLVDLEFKGSLFTWANNRDSGMFIRERLDRAVCNGLWRSTFQNAILFNLDPIGSDHSPIVLHCNYRDVKTPRTFKFELMWLAHPDFLPIVKANWFHTPVENLEIVKEFKKNLDRLRIALSKWSRKEFGNSSKEIAILLDELNNCYMGSWNEDKAAQVKGLKEKLNSLWEREEKYWAQRSRIQWLKEGDKNTIFFHLSTIIRRQRNKIVKLKSDNGGWIED